MKRFTILILVLILGASLAACGTATKPGQSNLSPTMAQPSPIQQREQNASQDLIRTDTQGAVTVNVQPENLTNPGSQLIFDISLNTHSVDLSMDLAALATLSTDNGEIVQAKSWEAPRGGHHVSGTLSFPANLDGKPVLSGATKLTLIIKNVDAQERVFTWNLQN